MLRLTRYQVNGFRSVRESGWITVDDVTALIGVNESGKTNLLLPLWKLNPAKDGQIQPLADYPRSDYTSLRNLPKSRVFVRAEFHADSALRDELAALTGVDAERFAKVQMARRFDGMYEITFPEAGPEPLVPAPAFVKTLQDLGGDLATANGDGVRRATMGAALDEAMATLDGLDQLNASHIEAVEESLAKVASEEQATELERKWSEVLVAASGLTKRLTASHPNSNKDARQLALKRLPKFVYYSNYGNLDSEIYLPHVIANMERADLGAKEAAKARTLKVLFEFVGLSPQEVLELGKAATTTNRTPTPEDIEAAAARTKERSVLLQSASSKLTKEFREWWKQGDYRFRFEADGDHFRIWVSDDKRPEEIELESRSTGLQWFLSFFLVFLVESNDTHADSILLLDEPGLTLHPLAQKDLAVFFDSLARTNQLLYTTHSPFLLDADALHRVRNVFVTEEGTTSVSADLRAGKARSSEARSIYAVHAALGLSVSDALLQGCEVVIVEGASDQHYLSAIKSVLVRAGKCHPPRELLFAPSGGAKGVNAIAPIVTAKDEQPPCVMLDSDSPGKTAAKALKSGGIYGGTNAKRVIEVGTHLPNISDAEVEDLMPHETIVDAASRMFRGETDFRDVAEENKPIVPQIEAYARSEGLELQHGWKVDLAIAVKQRLLKTGFDKLPKEVTSRWAELFANFGNV